MRERPSALPSGPAPEGATVAEALRSRLFWMLAVVQLGTTMVQNRLLVHLSALLGAAGAQLLSGAASLGVGGEPMKSGVLRRSCAVAVRLAIRLGTAPARAEGSSTELANQLANPLASQVSVPFPYNHGP